MDIPAMREISTFCQQCIALIDDPPPEGVVIIRDGRPVAKLLPIRSSPSADLIGSVPLHSDKDDDLLSTGERWDAES